MWCTLQTSQQENNKAQILAGKKKKNQQNNPWTCLSLSSEQNPGPAQKPTSEMPCKDFFFFFFSPL